MMKKHILLIAIAATSLSSCSLYKNYERPTDLPTSGLYGSAQTGQGEHGLGAKAWREFFTDPTLQGLIQQGLTQNASIRQIDLQIQEAQEYLKVSKLAYIPSLAIAPQGGFSGKNDSQASGTYSIPLSASWQIGSLGSLRNAKKSAQVAVEQTKAARQAVQQSLVANIASLYYTLCLLDAELAISEQTAVNWRETVKKTEQLMAAGRSNKAALAQTRANCYSVESSVIDLRQAITETENALCTILGETPHHIQRTSLDSFRMPAAVETGVPMALLQNRPDVKQAELKLASAFYAVNSAKAAFYPSLTLTGTASLNYPGDFLWSTIGSLVQPIFQNGRLRAQKRVAEAQQEEAKIAFAQSLVAAGNEVNSALSKMQTAKAKEALIQGQVTSLQDAVDATQALYENNISGAVNYLNVITAQTGLLSAQLGQLSNKFDGISATIEFYQALGGGSLAEEKMRINE